MASVSTADGTDGRRVRLTLRGESIEFLEHRFQIAPWDDENEDVGLGIPDEVE